MKRIIATILILLIAAPAFGNGIFMSYTTSQRLEGDIRYMREAIQVCGEQNALLTKESSLLTSQNTDLKKMVDGLEKDKEALKVTTADYKKMYEKADDARLKCEESKPSRATWFGLGYIAGLLTSIAALLGF